MFTCLFLAEEFVETEMISKISSPQIFHDHVEIFSILKGRNHIDDEGVAQLFEDRLFVDD